MSSESRAEGVNNNVKSVLGGEKTQGQKLVDGRSGEPGENCCCNRQDSPFVLASIFGRNIVVRGLPASAGRCVHNVVACRRSKVR